MPVRGHGAGLRLIAYGTGDCAPPSGFVAQVSLTTRPHHLVVNVTVPRYPTALIRSCKSGSTRALQPDPLIVEHIGNAFSSKTLRARAG